MLFRVAENYNLPTAMDVGAEVRDGTPREAQLILAAHIDNGVDKLKRAKSVSDLIQY